MSVNNPFAVELTPMEASLIRAFSLAKAAEPAPKKPKTPTYNLTMEQIAAIKKSAVHDAVEAAWVLMLGLPVMALTDKHGFTAEQVDQLVDDILDLHDSYEKGYLTLEDIHATLKEEHGLVIREKEKKRRKFK